MKSKVLHLHFYFSTWDLYVYVIFSSWFFIKRFIFFPSADCSKPVVAVVEGLALEGGLELTMVCVNCHGAGSSDLY